MLTKKEIEKLPNHRLKSYLKSVRKSNYLAEQAYLNCPLGREVQLKYKAEFKEVNDLFNLVKTECDKRSHFK